MRTKTETPELATAAAGGVVGVGVAALVVADDRLSRRNLAISAENSLENRRRAERLSKLRRVLLSQVSLLFTAAEDKGVDVELTSIAAKGVRGVTAFLVADFGIKGGVKALFLGRVVLFTEVETESVRRGSTVFFLEIMGDKTVAVAVDVRNDNVGVVDFGVRMGVTGLARLVDETKC